MRWTPFFILAYVLIAIQVGLAGAGNLGARPNLVLLGAVFIALNAPRQTALLACFLLGLLQDLMTLQPVGLSAVEYGLVALLVLSAQDVVYRRHPLTHAVLGLVCGMAGALVVLLHGWLYGWLHPHGPLAGVAAGRAFMGALWTAIVAPIVLGILQRTTYWFAFRTIRAAAQGRVMRSAGTRMRA